MDIPAILLNEHFDDRYFDVVNAIDEAQTIYFEYNHIVEKLSGQHCKDASSSHNGNDETYSPSIQTNSNANSSGNEEPQGPANYNSGYYRRSLTIGETGFGAGRILVALLEYIKMNKLKDISIEYYSVELYPLSLDRLTGILESFRSRAGEEIDTVINAYKDIDTTTKNWHTTAIMGGFGTLTLNLFIGEALDMVQSLQKPCDVWFLDGHGPKKNPSIWRPELLQAIGEKTKPGGTCSTFTVSGTVKTALRSAGFQLQKLPGCGGKKHVLYGIKEP